MIYGKNALHNAGYTIEQVSSQTKAKIKKERIPKGQVSIRNKKWKGGPRYSTIKY